MPHRAGHGPSTSHRQASFRGLYSAHVDAVLGYALRRVDRPEDAGDIVSQTFLVAWRRFSDVPEGEGARLWLYGVARRTLAHHRSGEVRHSTPAEPSRCDLGAVGPCRAVALTEREALRDALSRLAARNREVLELAAWEELEPHEIAEVLGISPVAVRSRLSRSRGVRRPVLGNDPPQTGEYGQPPVPGSSPRGNAPVTAWREAGRMESEPVLRPTSSLDARREDVRLRRLSRQTLGASGLFERRPELKDVATWSDGVVESVLWSA